MSKIKQAKEEFSKDKIKWILIAGVIGLVLKDCGGFILSSARESTLNYLDMPKEIEAVKKDMIDIQRDIRHIKYKLRMNTNR